ncbi:centromere/kinetochore protein zw10 homolog [Nematostella vectensis]|uniref:centromere/kinetochore protein zw10 homolog n=1 Tax=Nematostella vectensis TaxID=45351 RepID=UPI00207789D0|nr:centromere/kinetochore protein zw10 homolog [Nematostella vectensis]
MAATEKPLDGVKTSLVTDVLQKTGQLEQEDFNKCATKMLKKAEEVKAEVFNTIYKEYSYAGFQDLSSSTSELNWKVSSLLKEIDATTKKVKGSILPDLDAAAEEHANLVQQLKETDMVRVILIRLGKIHLGLETLPGTLKSKAFCKAAKLLEDLREDLEHVPRAGQEGKIFIALREELRRLSIQLVNKLDTTWNNCLLWSIPTSSSLDSAHAHLKTQLKLCTYGSEITEVINALAFLGRLEQKLKIFGKKLIQFIYRPLIIFPNLKVSVEKDKEDITISLVRDTTKCKIVEPGKVYSKIIEVLEVLCTYFTPSQDNSGLPKISILQYLGNFLWPALSEDLIKDCLAKSIPNTSAQLEKYQEVISQTEKFEEELHKLEIVDKLPSSLTKYAKDVGVHFGNKKCQDLLVTARDLMKDDIYNTVMVDRFTDTALLVTPQEIQEALLGKKSKEISEITKSDNEETLSEFTFHFPTCRISESTKKLMDLAYSTLIEATTSPFQTAVQLFYTVRNVFELYCSVVPAYHQDNLATLPQLSALHHNNCMYISHLLMTAGHQFSAQLPEPLGVGTVTFMDLVPTVREIGEKCLFEQLKRQRSQLLSTIRAAEGFADANEDHRSSQIERALKQVLHQLSHLSKIWKGVLPEDLFYHSLGALLDAVIQEITNEVLKLEDLSSDEAHQLNFLLNVVINKAPELFPDPSSAVPHWSRYSQLISILESSLQEITDSWGNGNGPLAQDFSAGEIRNLIRALFQNTDRRAAALAKIKAS